MTKSSKPDFSTYPRNMDRVSLRQDITTFLLWAKEKHPKVFVSYTEICQRINGFSRAPAINSKQVLAIRGASSAVRKALMEQHACGLITDSVSGMRATTDSADLLETQMVRVSRSLRASQKMFGNTAGLINIKEVPNTPENSDLRKWWFAGVAPVARVIAETDFFTKLLPPKKEVVKEVVEVK